MNKKNLIVKGKRLLNIHPDEPIDTIDALIHISRRNSTFTLLLGLIEPMGKLIDSLPGEEPKAIESLQHQLAQRDKDVNELVEGLGEMLHMDRADLFHEDYDRLNGLVDKYKQDN